MIQNLWYLELDKRIFEEKMEVFENQCFQISQFIVKNLKNHQNSNFRAFEVRKHTILSIWGTKPLFSSKKAAIVHPKAEKIVRRWFSRRSSSILIFMAFDIHKSKKSNQIVQKRHLSHWYRWPRKTHWTIHCPWMPNPTQSAPKSPIHAPVYHTIHVHKMLNIQHIYITFYSSYTEVVVAHRSSCVSWFILLLLLKYS